MYETFGPYIQSEIDYRRERLSTGASRKARHPRFPRIRRGTDAATTTR